jgi:hypothetical protein
VGSIETSGRVTEWGLHPPYPPAPRNAEGMGSPSGASIPLLREMLKEWGVLVGRASPLLREMLKEWGVVVGLASLAHINHNM